jgi:hypothetical protein
MYTGPGKREVIQYMECTIHELDCDGSWEREVGTEENSVY